MEMLVLTKPQREWVDWALEAMRDYVEDDSADYRDEELPRLTSAGLVLADDDFRASDVAVGDMVYRLETQAAEMGDDFDTTQHAAAAYRPAANVAAALRQLRPKVLAS